MFEPTVTTDVSSRCDASRSSPAAMMACISPITLVPAVLSDEYHTRSMERTNSASRRCFSRMAC